jgi:arsenite/tail-anchored protein-transporting ATPase
LLLMSTPPLIESILNRRLLFVGGKGGVGKTTVASALGLLAARRGRRCLLVSTDPAHSLGDVFDREVSNARTKIADGLWGIEIDSDAEAERYIDAVTARMKQFAMPDMHAEVDRQMELARMSPGAMEAALLERVSRIMADDADDYDLIIFDTAPTGHTLRLLSLPEAMAAWTDGLLASRRRASDLGKVQMHLSPRQGRAGIAGPLDDPDEDSLEGLDRRTRGIAETLLERRRLFHRSRRMLLDAETTAFIFVLTPERLPILETVRAVSALNRMGVPIAAGIVNRILPSLEHHFLKQRRKQETRHLDALVHELPDLPLLHLPMLPEDIHGLTSLTAFARHLEAAS